VIRFSGCRSFSRITRSAVPFLIHDGYSGFEQPRGRVIFNARGNRNARAAMTPKKFIRNCGRHPIENTFHNGGLLCLSRMTSNSPSEPPAFVQIVARRLEPIEGVRHELCSVLLSPQIERLFISSSAGR
jgi:hypothetical protein